MPRLIGDGSVIDMGDLDAIDPRDQQIESLKTENRRLQRALSDAKLDAERAHEDANRALGMLRGQLGGLYRALQAVFGELDAAGVTETAPSAQPAGPGRPPDTDKAKWDEWKQCLGPSCAKVIDALLLGGEMSVEAIKTASRMGRQTVYQATSTMGRAGILVKNGGKFSLKAL